MENDFPWEHIDECRHKRYAGLTETTEGAIRTRLEGAIAPCPKCGKTFKDMEVIYFTSPSGTWQMLCGQSGWMVICPDCKKQIWYECEILS